MKNAFKILLGMAFSAMLAVGNTEILLPNDKSATINRIILFPELIKVPNKPQKKVDYASVESLMRSYWSPYSFAQWNSLYLSGSGPAMPNDSTWVVKSKKREPGSIFMYLDAILFFQFENQSVAVVKHQFAKPKQTSMPMTATLIKDDFGNWKFQNLYNDAQVIERFFGAHKSYFFSYLMDKDEKNLEFLGINREEEADLAELGKSYLKNENLIDFVDLESKEENIRKLNNSKMVELFRKIIESPEVIEKLNTFPAQKASKLKKALKKNGISEVNANDILFLIEEKKYAKALNSLSKEKGFGEKSARKFLKKHVGRKLFKAQYLYFLPEASIEAIRSDLQKIAVKEGDIDQVLKNVKHSRPGKIRKILANYGISKKEANNYIRNWLPDGARDEDWETDDEND